MSEIKQEDREKILESYYGAKQKLASILSDLKMGIMVTSVLGDMLNKEINKKTYESVVARLEQIEEILGL